MNPDAHAQCRKFICGKTRLAACRYRDQNCGALSSTSPVAVVFSLPLPLPLPIL